MSTPGRGADNPRRRVHHRLPGGRGVSGQVWADTAGRSAGAQGDSRAAGGWGPSVQASGASRVPREHGSRTGRGREGTGRGGIAAAGSALRALAVRVSWLRWGHHRLPPVLAPRGPQLYTSQRTQGPEAEPGDAGPTRRQPPAGTARGHAQTLGHRPALISGRAAWLSLPWAVSGVPPAPRQVRPTPPAPPRAPPPEPRPKPCWEGPPGAQRRLSVQPAHKPQEGPVGNERL